MAKINTYPVEPAIPTAATHTIATKTGTTVQVPIDRASIATAAREGGLTADIAVVAATVTAEAATRTTADTALQSNITAEASTRATADTALQTNITAEASVRAAGDASVTALIPPPASTAATGAGTPGSGYVEPSGLLSALSAVDPNEIQAAVQKLASENEYDVRQNIQSLFPLATYAGLTNAQRRDLLQYALDNAPIGSTVVAPEIAGPPYWGLAKAASADSFGRKYCLKLTRYVHVRFNQGLYAELTETVVGENDDVDALLIDIETSFPFVVDCRALKIHANIVLNNGGRSSINCDARHLWMFNTLIEGSLHGLKGVAVHCGGLMLGSAIAPHSQINGGVRFGQGSNGEYHADGSHVGPKCNIFGDNGFAAITLDAIFGATSHTYNGNILTSPFGALNVINGWGVTFTENQCEGTVGVPINNPQGALIRFGTGNRYRSSGEILRNNVGGGDVVQLGLYVDNVSRLIYDDNRVELPQGASPKDVEMTTNSRNVVVGDRNEWRIGSNPITLRSPVIVDAGTANRGFGKLLSSAVAFQNSWTSSDGEMLLTGRVVKFSGTLTGGTLTGGTIIGVLPLGYRPTKYTLTRIYSSGGDALIGVNTLGEIIVGSAPGSTLYLDGLSFITTGSVL